VSSLLKRRPPEVEIGNHQGQGKGIFHGSYDKIIGKNAKMIELILAV
jgi:hypothetical protein